MFRPDLSILAAVGAAVLSASASPTLGALLVADHTGDGVLNVLDVARERGLSPDATPASRGIETGIGFDPMDQMVDAGGEVRVLVLIEESAVGLFGYSLDIDIAPVGAATGSLVPNVSLTNFFDARNLISAGGAMRDGFFSVIEGSADGGVFISTNTNDLSAVFPVPGVNDVLAELVLDASTDAAGEFRIEFGSGTALSDTAGMPIAFASSSATVMIAPEGGNTGDTHYEQGDRDGDNNMFDTREPVDVADPFCSFISGKLQENSDPGRFPDTYLFMFDKDDNVICEDDNSSSKGNGKASACYDVEPVSSGDGSATIRLGVTGRPDGVDNMFNGLFFNGPHQQLGEAEVCITYYDESGDEISTDLYTVTFVTGAEAFRINYVVPEGTASVDVELDNTTETFPVCNDVDFYELDGLEEACDYVLTVIGGTDEFCNPSCAILGWYDKNGNLVQVAPIIHDRNGIAGQGAQLSVISDANGRIRLSVSGEGDEDFDGWLDESDTIIPPRNVGTPGYEPPPAHGCCACYTIKVAWNKHLPDGQPAEPGGGSEGEEFLLLSNGDLNLDGGVDVIDLAILLNNWGWTAP